MAGHIDQSIIAKPAYVWQGGGGGQSSAIYQNEERPHSATIGTILLSRSSQTTSSNGLGQMGSGVWRPAGVMSLLLEVVYVDSEAADGPRRECVDTGAPGPLTSY